MADDACRLSRAAERSARDLAARARFGARLRAAAVFGSHARGASRHDSDVDVFLLVEALDERERRELFELSGEVSLDNLVTVQAFAPLPAEHEWLRVHECRILRDIAADGVPV